TISFGINLFLFGNANGNLSNRAIEAYPFQIETIGKVSICGAEEIPSLHNSQSPLASASRSHADRKFSYQVSVNLVMICSAVCPAIFKPEWTMSPQVSTRVPFPECSSKLTHCARTTPSEWSIHPTLCAGWQLVITWLTTVFTGSSTSMSSRLPASHGLPSRQATSP